MPTIFSRSAFCQELISELGAGGTIPVPLYLSVLTTCASGINPNRVYQGQTRPPLTLVLYKGRDIGFNDDDYTWHVDIKQVSTGNLIVSDGPVVFSTDENNDPVFRYAWQYGDTNVTGKYEAQVYGQLAFDGRYVVFEPYKYIVRPRV